MSLQIPSVMGCEILNDGVVLLFLLQPSEVGIFILFGCISDFSLIVRFRMGESPLKIMAE